MAAYKGYRLAVMDFILDSGWLKTYNDYSILAPERYDSPASKRQICWSQGAQHQEQQLKRLKLSSGAKDSGHYLIYDFRWATSMA